MIPLFLGLTIANVLLLSLVFSLGLMATDGAKPTGFYVYHISLGIAAGLMTTLAHLAIYTYFMATTRWLQAATDKADLDVHHFVEPALRRKSRAFAVAMSAIVATALTMFAGAAADPTIRPWWSGEIHLTMAAIAITINVLCALKEYQLIRQQSDLMDEATRKVTELGLLGSEPHLPMEQT